MRDKPLTHKEEAFAVRRAAGEAPPEAYIGAGYAWSGSRRALLVEASKLEQRPKVAGRISELRDEYAMAQIEAARGEIPKEKAKPYGVIEAMAELDQAFAVALAKDNPGAMAKVVEVRMKLYGLGVSDAKNPKDKEEVPPEEMEAMLATLQAIKEKRAQSGPTH